jgi:hypothetical protein
MFHSLLLNSRNINNQNRYHKDKNRILKINKIIVF